MKFFLFKKIYFKNILFNSNYLKLFTLLFLYFSLSTSTSFAEQKGSLEDGKRKISMCVGCHGIPNYKTAFPKTYRVPKIAGQNSGYLVSALKAYREGQRSHQGMQAVAGSMTDQDIEDVAIFYSSLK